jgi:hypothetical protein
MVTLLSRPEPTTWLSVPPEQAPQPCMEGLGYRSSSGEQLLSSQTILDRVFPHPSSLARSRSPEARNPLVLEACSLYAASRFNPAAAPWNPSEARFHGCASTITALIQHPFWEQIDVLAAPLHLRHRHLAVATTAELLVRFRNGGDIGLGICQCGQPDELNPRRVAAEIGAAIALLGDTYSWWPRRAFVLFCCPGSTKVETIEADTAVLPWLDAMDLFRSMARLHSWEEQL